MCPADLLKYLFRILQNTSIYFKPFYRWECGRRIKIGSCLSNISKGRKNFITGWHVGSTRALTCCTLACSRSPSLSTSSVKVGRSWGFPCQQSNMVWYLRSREQHRWTQSGWLGLSSHRKDTCDRNYQWFLNTRRSFVAWLCLVCLSHQGWFLLILILSVLIASLCSSWADLRESTGVFGCLTSCLHLRPRWKNPQSFHFSCLSAFAKEFSRNLARRAVAIYTLQCMTAPPWSGPGSDGWTLPTATSHRFIWEVKTATWLILLDWRSFDWRRRRRTGPVWLPWRSCALIILTSRWYHSQWQQDVESMITALMHIQTGHAVWFHNLNHISCLKWE